jgi:hypothetical protein
MKARPPIGTSRRRFWTWCAAIVGVGVLALCSRDLRVRFWRAVFPPSRIVVEWVRVSPDGKKKIECSLLDWGAGVSPMKNVVLKSVGAADSGEEIYCGNYRDEVSGSWVTNDEVLIEVSKSRPGEPAGTAKEHYDDVFDGTKVCVEYR